MQWGDIAELGKEGEDYLQGCQPFEARTPPPNPVAALDPRAQPAPGYEYAALSLVPKRVRTPEDGEIVEELGDPGIHRTVLTYGSCFGKGLLPNPLPRPPPPPSYISKPAYTRPFKPPCQKKWLAFIFIRVRQWHAHQWYEYFMEFRRNEYSFPQSEVRTPTAIPDCATQVTTFAARRGLLSVPRNINDLERFFQMEVYSQGTAYRVYLVPMDATQRPRATRQLPGPPAMAWITEAELAVRLGVSDVPTAFGCQFSPRSLHAHTSLPIHLRFASECPPLVMYHGTDADAAAAIAATGFLPSTKIGMLGPGIYFAQWDKAVQFSAEDANRKKRSEPGKVLRCYAFPKNCVTMTADKICTCGCGQPYVDHNVVHAAGAEATFVPDHSLPATRRAEWCVRNPDCIMVDAVFHVKS
jgi:hypothetical protein